MNVYQKILNYCNQNAINYTEKLTEYVQSLSIDGYVSNQYYFVCLHKSKNSRTTITDITFDIENLHGELYRIENRISYNKLINELGAL